jgi:hypothetical protein
MIIDHDELRMSRITVIFINIGASLHFFLFNRNYFQLINTDNSGMKNHAHEQFLRIKERVQSHLVVHLFFVLNALKQAYFQKKT